jgi:actin-related protein
VVSGGGSKFRGLAQRLEAELKRAAPGEAIKVIATNDGQSTSFLGGSILSSCTVFPSMTITCEEYHEYGSGIVNRKCL